MIHPVQFLYNTDPQTVKEIRKDVLINDTLNVTIWKVMKSGIHLTFITKYKDKVIKIDL